MKKIFTYVALLALCGTANAASLKTLSLGIGTPGVYEPSLQIMDISADGRYVCGILEVGLGYFVGDLNTGTMVYGISEDEDSELRHINNKGVAIGFDGDNGMTFTIDEEQTLLVAPEGYKYVLGEDITNDGSIRIGSAIGAGYIGYGAYCKDGGQWELLARDFGEEVNLGAYEKDGSYAKFISGDGKIILGCIGNFGPALLWSLDDNEQYVPNFIAEKYTMLSSEDVDKKFASLTAHALSDNGKYALLRATENNDERRSYPVIYNTETGEMKYYDEVQDIDEIGIGLYPTAICNDGSFVGIIGMPMFGDMGAFIMKAGATQAETFVEAFPEYSEYLGMLDMLSCHMPITMSADGRYIGGYGWNSPDPYADDPIFYFESYVLDTTEGGVTGIDAVEAASADAVPVEYFTIDGRRNSGTAKGLNIVRMSDGSVRKVVK